ncbi:MAG TPA: DUF11 domain-containing protein [Acidimicrobiia bacterium]|nr:DUF11 domain-containing protein [Acidimicrobiia bacterium]
MKRIILALLSLTLFIGGISILPAHADTIPDVRVSLAIFSDGTPSFDVGAPDPDQPGGAGLDANANNGIVKTQDSSVITVDWATGDIAVTNMVLTVTPEAGLTVDAIPAACRNGSTFTPSKLTCLLGNQPGGQTGSFPLTLAMGTVLNASTHDVVATVSSEEAPLATSNTITLIASAAPNVNLNFDFPDVTQIGNYVNPGTLDLGKIFFFPVTVDIGGNGKGAEPLNPSEPLDFRIDLSNLPGSHEVVDDSWVFPNEWASTQRCGPNDKANTEVPYGKIGVNSLADVNNSTVDSGKWTCTYNSGLDSLDVHVEDADLSPTTFPRYGGSPFNQFAPRKVMIAGVVPVFVSDTDLIAISGFPGVGVLPSMEVSWINDPNGISGSPNVGESTSDDINQTNFIYRMGSDSLSTSYFGTPVDLIADGGFGVFHALNLGFLIPTLPGHKPYVPTQTQISHSGDGTVVPGQQFQISFGIGSTDESTPPFRQGACIQFSPGQSIAPQADTKVIDANAVGSANSFITGEVPPVSYQSNNGEIVLANSIFLHEFVSGAQLAPGSISSSDYLVEYSTDTHNNDDDCSDTYTWSSTPPSNLEDVTQVRVIMLRNFVSGEAVTFGLGMKALANPVGTKIFHTITGLTWAADTAFDPGDTWDINLGTPYSIADFCTLPANPPDVLKNDCLTIGGPTLQIDKKVVGANRNLKIGDIVEYEVQGYVIGQIPGVTENVVIDDSLPPGLEFTGVSNIAPTSGGADGDANASWDFGQVANGTTETITYEVRVLPGFNPFESFLNTATIRGAYDDGGGLVALDSETISVNVQSSGTFSQVNTLKSTSDPLIPVNGDLLFSLNYENTGTSDLGSVDVIDILPYVGDGRTAPSAFNGTTSLESVTPAGGENIYYTIAEPSTIVVDGDDSSNDIPGGSTLWCEATDVSAAPALGTAGCPNTVADATAFRLVRSGTFALGETFEANVVINTNGNIPGDLYSNDFAIRIGGLSLPALSNDVSVEVEGADFTLTKTARSASVTVGDNVTYDIAVTNTGNATANDVVLIDELPPGLEFVSASDGGVKTNGTISWSISSLGVNQTTTVSVTVKTTSTSAGLTNIARVLSTATPVLSSLPSDDEVIRVLSVSQLPFTGTDIEVMLFAAVLLLAGGLFLKKVVVKKSKYIF